MPRSKEKPVMAVENEPVIEEKPVIEEEPAVEEEIKEEVVMIDQVILFENIPDLRILMPDGKYTRFELHSSGVYWLYPV